MMGDAIGFIRKNGRIIPLRGASGAAHKVAKGALQAHHAIKNIAKIPKHTQTLKQDTKSKGIKVNRALDMTALGLSIASGVVAAATFSGGWKSLAAGAIASHVIDAAGIAANVASVTDKKQLSSVYGKVKSGNYSAIKELGTAKNKQAAIVAGKNEARNFVIGNAIYAAGLVGIKRNRTELAGYAKSILNFGRKALKVASKVE